MRRLPLLDLRLDLVLLCTCADRYSYIRGRSRRYGFRRKRRWPRASRERRFKRVVQDGYAGFFGVHCIVFLLCVNNFYLQLKLVSLRLGLVHLQLLSN